MGSEELIDSMDDGGFTPLRLSKLEQQILDLYDRMQDMQLEISLLQVSESIPVPKGMIHSNLGQYSRDLIINRI